MHCPVNLLLLNWRNWCIISHKCDCFYIIEASYLWKESMAYPVFCMLVQCVVSHTGNNHTKCIVLQYNKMMFWPVTTLVHVYHANVGSWTDHILQFCRTGGTSYDSANLCSRLQPPGYIIKHCPTNHANCFFFFLDVFHHLMLFMFVVNAYTTALFYSK